MSETAHKIYFEPGWHSWFLNQYEEVDRRHVRGDTQAHHWNPSVAKRMRKYSPYVLGLDSLFPTQSEDDPIKLSWEWMPGSPKQMTGRNSIYVVAGDVLHQDTAETGDSPLWGDFYSLGWKKVWQVGKEVSVEGLVPILASVGILSWIVARNPTITRRSFLKGGIRGLAGLAGLFGLGKLAPAFHSDSENHALSPVYQYLTELGKPRIVSSTWLDGRAALLIAKTAGAFDRLDLPSDATASVVMGWPHAYEGYNLLNSVELRTQVIRRYAQEFYQDVFPIVQRIYEMEDNTENRQNIRNVVAYFFARSEISNFYQLEDLDTIWGSLRVARYIEPEIENVLSDFGDPKELFMIAP